MAGDPNSPESARTKRLEAAGDARGNVALSRRLASEVVDETVARFFERLVDAAGAW